MAESGSERPGGEGAGAEGARSPEAPAVPPRWEWRLTKVLLFLTALAAFAYAGMWSLMPVSREEKTVIVEIPRNWGVRQIAGRLKRLGLIRSEWTFLLAGRILGDWRHLKAGEYELSPSLTPVQILDKLARGDVRAYWVTIPEGATIKEIARIFHRMQLGDPTRFIAIASRGGLRLGADYGVPRRNLEGYLFPDTYKVPRDIDERQLVRAMVRSFQREVLQGLADEIRNRTNGLSVEETVVLASLVEREARLPEERARIAGVLTNRLRRGMKLECDATVQYALGKTKARLLYKDLQIESPYNTYRHRGLPPGPIGSPGLASLRAALNPERHDYLFYVADGKTGRHLFSRTFDEHRAAIRKVRGG
ncbi:MAG: endolytic transglycosylase MltG [Armatimonadetes bacterium]|nr:endolytic transglycosylase MltG [Armatimonadota bacterium]